MKSLLIKRRKKLRKEMTLKNPYRIYCVNCRSMLYFYYGEFTGKPKISQFKPSEPTVHAPTPGKKMLCSKCNKPWYMVNVRGGLVVMTDRGWKPREPEGDSKGVLTPYQDGTRIDYRFSHTEFGEK